MNGKRPTIAIIIPTKDRPVDLERAVRSCLAQSSAPSEIVVVDQSRDRRAEKLLDTMMAAAPGTRLVYIFNNGLSGLTAAKNAGIAGSGSDILLFIDDDIVLDRGFLAEILAVYAFDPGLAGVGGVARLPGHKTSPLRRIAALVFQLGPFSDPRALLQAGFFAGESVVPSWLLSGGLSSVKRDVFRAALFNERLTGASPVEDMDFYSRCRGKFRFALAPRATALHNVSPASRGGLKRAFERKCLGFFHIYREYIPKNIPNGFAFCWKLFGIFVDAAFAAAASRSSGPLRGMVNALWTAASGRDYAL